MFLATLTVVTRGRKNDKRGLIILTFCNELKAAISAETSNATQESRSPEVNIYTDTQNKRNLRNLTVHCRVSCSSPPVSMPIRMSPLHNFPFRLSRYIFNIICFSTPKYFKYFKNANQNFKLLTSSFCRLLPPIFSFITEGSFRPTVLKSHPIYIFPPSCEGQSFTPIKITNTIIALHSFNFSFL